MRATGAYYSWGKPESQHKIYASEFMDLGRRELGCLYTHPSQPSAEGCSQGYWFPSTSSSHLNSKVGSSSRRAHTKNCRYYLLRSGHSCNVLTILLSEVRWGETHIEKGKAESVLTLLLCSHFPGENIASHAPSRSQSRRKWLLGTSTIIVVSKGRTERHRVIKFRIGSSE